MRLAAPEPPASGGREETIGPRLAGRTDPGVKHSINQDAFALSGSPAGDDGTIVVVCDGVSNSQTPDLAAATAAAPCGRPSEMLMRPCAPFHSTGRPN